MHLIAACLESELGHTFPAATLCVLQRGEILYEAAVGVYDPETDPRPLDASAIFDLASLTKLFTTTAFLRLVAHGRVDLDQAAASVLPEFSGPVAIGGAEDPLTKKPTPPDAAFAGQVVDRDSITFRDLLTHRSGLPAWRRVYAVAGAPPPPGGIADAGERVRRHARGVAAIVRCPFVAPPRQCVIYSDLGLILMGEAVARLLGLPLDYALDELVLSPLGMERVRFTPLDAGLAVSEIAPTEVCSWRRRRLRGEVHDENAAGLGGVAGHAGLFGCARAVAMLGQVYLDRGRWQGSVFLPSELARAACSEQVRSGEIRRAIGWMLKSGGESPCGTLFSQQSFGHTGFTGTSLWVDPERALVVAFLTNRVYYGRAPDAILCFRPQLHNAIITSLQGE